MGSSSQAARLAFRIIITVILILFLFYVGRPLYWKISATIHDIRHNKQTVSGGFSELVSEAQKLGGWFQDESDSGIRDHKTTRRILLRRV